MFRIPMRLAQGRNLVFMDKNINGLFLRRQPQNVDLDGVLVASVGI